MPPSDPRAADAASASSLEATDAPASPMRAAVSAFLGTKKGQAFLRDVITRRLGKDVDSFLMDDIVELANLRALESKWLPLFEPGIPGWVRRLTRRAIAEHFRAGKTDEKWLDPERRSDEVRDPDAVASTDDDARGRLIMKWLEGQVSEPRDRETLHLLSEHEVEGRSLMELATARGTTPQAMADRFYRFRKKYVPQVARMDDEKTRRTVFVVLLLAFGAALALLAWWLLGPSPIVAEPPAPPARAVPSASAPPPAPSFDQALPPPEDPDRKK